MVKHIVTFKFKGNPDERTRIAKNFAGALIQLPEQIEQLKSMEVGLNINPEEDWDLVLTAIADSLDDIKAYANHPAHQEAVQIIRDLIDGRACVDYEITED